MSGYEKTIIEATQCSKADAAAIEEVMREKFRVLDGIPRDEFFNEAKAAYRTVRSERGEGPKLAKLSSYKKIALDAVPGKTVEKVMHGKVDGAHGKEPIVWLCFTDGTRTGFVLPKDE